MRSSLGDKVVLVHRPRGGMGVVLGQCGARAYASRWTWNRGFGRKRQVALGARLPCGSSTTPRRPFVARTLELSEGGVQVVYDLVGQGCSSPSARSGLRLRPRGMAINFGTASGNVVEAFDLQLLHHKSLTVCRPTLRRSFIGTPAEFQGIWRRRSSEAVANGAIRLARQPPLRPGRRAPGAPGSSKWAETTGSAAILQPRSARELAGTSTDQALEPIVQIPVKYPAQRQAGPGPRVSRAECPPSGSPTNAPGPRRSAARGSCADEKGAKGPLRVELGPGHRACKRTSRPTLSAFRRRMFRLKFVAIRPSSTKRRVVLGAADAPQARSPWSRPPFCRAARWKASTACRLGAVKATVKSGAGRAHRIGLQDQRQAITRRTRRHAIAHSSLGGEHAAVAQGRQCGVVKCRRAAQIAHSERDGSEHVRPPRLGRSKSKLTGGIVTTSADRQRSVRV